MDYESIKQEYEADKTVTLKQLAQKHGVHPSTLSKHLKGLGVKIRRGGRAISNSMETQVVQDYLQDETLSMPDIAMRYNISRQTVAKVLQRNNIPSRTGNRKYIVNHHYFDNIDTPAKAYFLGLMAADGQVQKGNIIRLDLMSQDRHIIESFVAELESTYPIAEYPVRDTTVSRLVVRSEQMFVSLLQHGVEPNKTLTLKPAKTIPYEFISHYLRGYFDGDGCLTRNQYTNKYSFSLLGTQEFVSFAQECLGVSHLKLQQRFPERQKNNYTLSIGGNRQILRIMEFLYQGSTPETRLERKYLKFLELKNNPHSHKNTNCP